MADAIRFGIIGTGMMGVEHARNLALVDGVEVTAVADPHPPSLDWVRPHVGPDVRFHDDYRRLLTDGSVDAVVVSTPNHTHATVLRDLFETDLHLLVEKPLCTTLDDCREVEEAAAGHRGVVQVGMEYRYMPPVAALAGRVRDGSIGRLRMLAIREHRFPFLPKVGDWNRFSRNTGGTLVEKCCHFFDLMHWITGSRAARVYASGGQDVNHLDERYDGEVPDILDNAFAVIDFESGARTLLDLCMFAEGSRNQEEIAATGDVGKVECFIPESTLVVGRRIPRAVETETIAVAQDALDAGYHHGATYFQHVAFRDAIRHGRAPDVSVRDGLLAVAVGQAAERSVKERRPVELAELGL